MTAALATLPRPAETAAQRIQRLQRELAAAGLDLASAINGDVEHLALRLAEAADLAALPPGLRDLYRRLAEHLGAQGLSAAALTDRAR